MALITASAYKTYRNISVSTYDTLLGVLIANAQELIETYVGRTLESGALTESYDGDGSEILQLKNYPVSALTSIVITSDSGTTETVSSSDYRLDADSGRVFRIGAARGRWVTDSFGQFVGPYEWGVSPCWPEGFQNITVTYTAGYSSIPGDLVQAMYELVDLLFLPVKDGGRDPTVQSETLGDYSYTNAVVAAGGMDRVTAFLHSRLVSFRRMIS